MKKNFNDALTIEQLDAKFASKFDLLVHAMDLVKNKVKSGAGARVETTVMNPAYWVLQEIAEGKDKFEDITGSKPKAAAPEVHVAKLESKEELLKKLQIADEADFGDDSDDDDDED